VQSERNQYGARLRFWEGFEEAGGCLRMEKILAESREEVVKSEVLKIW
jgi:hypothetical protein